jgi:hypothetical protein
VGARVAGGRDSTDRNRRSTDRTRAGPRSFDALTLAGWIATGGFPAASGNDFYFGYRVAMRDRDGGEIRVHWRSLPHTDFALRRPPLPVLEPIPAEHSLVAALGGDMEDRLGWECDALFLCPRSGLDWNVITELLRWRSKARNRLEKLRREGRVEIPAEVTRPPRSKGFCRRRSERFGKF